MNRQQLMEFVKNWIAEDSNCNSAFWFVAAEWKSNNGRRNVGDELADEPVVDEGNIRHQAEVHHDAENNANWDNDEDDEFFLKKKRRKIFYSFWKKKFSF